MLTENDVINILAKYLKENKYRNIITLTTVERGIDIIAEKNDIKLLVEAKGETSARKNSIRYNKPFTKNQVGTHVSVAILKTLKTIAENPKQKIKVAMAFPDNLNHRNVITPIAPLLKKIGIIIYLVKENKVNKI